MEQQGYTENISKGALCSCLASNIEFMFYFILFSQIVNLFLNKTIQHIGAYSLVVLVF